MLHLEASESIPRRDAVVAEASSAMPSLGPSVGDVTVSARVSDGITLNTLVRDTNAIRL